MTGRARLWAASVLSIASGAVFLASPPAAAATATFDCRESVTAYCEYIAANYCSSGSATCVYNTQTCDIINSHCNSAVLPPP